LKERLERGRALLRARLVRRGLGATALLLVSAWPAVAQAGVAASLVLSTVKAAATVAAGGAGTAAVSAKVAALAKAGLNAMTSAKLKVAIAFFVGAGVLGAGAVGLARQHLGAPDGPSTPQVAGQEKPPTPEGQKAANEKAAAQQAEEAARKARAARQAEQAQKGKPGKGEEAALRGAWTAVSGESGGRAVPAEAVKGYRLTFVDGKVTVQFAGQSKQGTFKLDPAAKPKTIDLDLDGGAAVGIYSLDGDALKLCFTEGGKEARPSEFSTKEGSGRVLLTLKRRAEAQAAGGKDEAADEGDLPQVAVLKQQLRALERENGALKEQVKRSREELDGVLTKVDAEKRTISFSLRGTKLTLEAVPLSGDAKFLTGEREVMIGDLKGGMGVSLQVRTDGDRTVVTAIKAPKQSDQ
jgi:uncharacterized protein (TIGR03067 family)